MPVEQTFEEFEREALERGFDEVISRSWQANAIVQDHTHPFAVDALMVAGDMWLTIAGKTRHLRPGDRFMLSRDEPHAEAYGPEGATYWVARRSRP